MNNEIDVIVDNRKTMIINGREFKIGKFKLMTVLRLIKLFANIMVKQAKQIRQGATNAEDIINMFELLDDETLLKVISVILETDDIEFCKTIDFSDFTGVIVTICEDNDFGKILGNVKRVAGLIMEKLAS